jgi:hypothetical protein
MNSARPKGQRFSQTYLDRAVPTQDSERMRVRIGQLMYAAADVNWRERFAKYATSELGVYVDDYFPSFTKKAEVRDILDSVTLFYEALSQTKGLQAANNFLTTAARVFREENLTYSVDESGGVHFEPDEEYSRNRESTIAMLQDARYANVLHAFDNARQSLSSQPTDGKGAVRYVFAANEGLFRLILPNSVRLGAKEAEQLRPIIAQNILIKSHRSEGL